MRWKSWWMTTKNWRFTWTKWYVIVIIILIRAGDVIAEYEIVLVFIISNVEWYRTQMTSLEEEKNRMLTSNCALAQENVDKEPEIIERKSRLNDMSEEAKELCAVVQEKLNALSKYNWLITTIITTSLSVHFRFALQNQKPLTTHRKPCWPYYRPKQPNAKSPPTNWSPTWRAKRKRWKNFWTNFWRRAKRCICADWKQTKCSNWYSNRKMRLEIRVRLVVTVAWDQLHIQIAAFTVHLLAACHIQRDRIRCRCLVCPQCPAWCTDISEIV